MTEEDTKVWWEALRGPSPVTRLRAVRLWMDVNGLPWEEAVSLEREVHRASGSDEELIERCKRICYNAACDPTLLERHPPEELALMGDTEMRCGALVRFEEAQEERRRVISALLKEKYDSVSSSASATLLRCRTCKGTDVSWQQKQTRGADESMTIFCTCASCGCRWKMS